MSELLPPDHPAAGHWVPDLTVNKTACGRTTDEEHAMGYGDDADCRACYDIWESKQAN